MLNSEIAQYLDALGHGSYDPTGTSGNIFIDALPSEPDEAIMIESTGGTEMDSLLGYDMPTVRMLVRGGLDPREPKQLALDIYNGLHGFSNGELVNDGIFVVGAFGVQSGPVNIGQDDNNRHRFSINFRFRVRNKSKFRE